MNTTQEITAVFIGIDNRGSRLASLAPIAIGTECVNKRGFRNVITNVEELKMIEAWTKYPELRSQMVKL